MARLLEIVFSFWPYEVVRTCGGLDSPSRKLMMSKKPPSAPSFVFSPTEMNVVGTPLATPIVYCMSRFASMPASFAPWGLLPPSSVCSVNVVAELRSGRFAVRNERRSAVCANWSMNPETPRTLDVCVALVVGIP